MQKEIMAERTVTLVGQYLEKYPEMRIADVYKLLYQACMGPEHAITDHRSVEVRLLEEWESVSANQDEELFENITLFHPIYRINLRPAKAGGIPPDKILRSFISLGKEFPKNSELFRSVWEVMSQKIKSEKIPLPDSAELDEFNILIEDNNCPAMHHSKEYTEAYRPAYRLVDKKIG